MRPQRNAPSFSAELIDHEIGQAAESADHEALAAAERRRIAEAEEPPETTRQKAIAAILLTSVAAALTVLNLLSLLPWGRPQVTTPTPGQLQTLVREELEFEVREIEFFREENGRLPANLEELGYGDEAAHLSYEPRGEHFALQLEDGALTLSYDSQSNPTFGP